MGNALCALRFGLGVEHGLSLFSRVYAWCESKKPLGIMICMQIVLLFLGCFIVPVSIMMVTVPIFMPIVKALDFNLVWFGLIFLISLDVGFLTPPFGMTLFVMKGVFPLGTTTADIYKAAVPFITIDLVAIVLIMAFPAVAVWLPEIM